MTIQNKYFVKQGTDAYQDFTAKWTGLTILSIDAFNKRGAPKNIYTGSWINSSQEDVFVPDVVYFEQPDVDVTFIVRDMDNHSVNVQNIHDSFVDYMTMHKTTIKSLYEKKEASFVCLKEYKPSAIKLCRQAGLNYIMGTLTLHRVTDNTNVTA